MMIMIIIIINWKHSLYRNSNAILTLWPQCSLFFLGGGVIYDPMGYPDNPALKGRINDDWWTGKNLDGKDRDFISCPIMDFAWRTWVTQQDRQCTAARSYDHNLMKTPFILLAYGYRLRQKYLTIWERSCEWNRWRGEFVLERPSSETQSISVAMERWSVEHRTFAVETYF